MAKPRKPRFMKQYWTGDVSQRIYYKVECQNKQTEVYGYVQKYKIHA